MTITMSPAVHAKVCTENGPHPVYLCTGCVAEQEAAYCTYIPNLMAVLCVGCQIQECLIEGNTGIPCTCPSTQPLTMTEADWLDYEEPTQTPFLEALLEDALSPEAVVEGHMGERDPEAMFDLRLRMSMLRAMNA